MSMLDDIIELKRQLAERPPVATQIWFVDRYAEYNAMLSYCKRADEVSRNFYSMPALLGMPLFNVESAAYNDSLPSFCMVSGIWAVMSDGSVKWLTDPYAQEAKISALTVDKNA